MNYTFLNKFLAKKFTKFFPKTINRKLLRKYKIFFVPVNYSKLPKNFYPVEANLKLQLNYVNEFRKYKKLINNTTKKNLDRLLYKIYKKKSFSFLDIGGDKIDLFLFLSHKLQIKRYFVLNFPEIISLFKLIKLKFNLNKFYPICKIDSLKNIDFVYCGSSIQYFKNYKFFLKNKFKKKPKFILFSGTSFFYNNLIKNDTIVVKQTNILPNTVYLYFFNLNNFTLFLEKNGYKLVSLSKNNTANIIYDNFKPFIKRIKYLDLLFVKK